MPYKPHDSSKSPMTDFQWDDVQADVLATDVSTNSKISSLKQLKTETKIPTKAINALNEQLKNAQASASDALQRVTAVEETQSNSTDLAQLTADVTALKTTVAELTTIVTRLRSYHEEEASYGDDHTQGNDDSQQGQGDTPDNPDNSQQDDHSQQQGGSDDPGNDDPQQDNPSQTEDPDNPTPIVYPEYDANGLPTKANAVYGMVLASEGGGAGIWKRVDQEYNDIAFDPTVHRTWKNIREVENENGKFVEFPVTWVKSETITEGKYAGKNCWWTADGPVEGFHVHPSFIGKDGNPHPLRIAKYLASKNATTGRPQSVDKGQTTGYWTTVNIDTIRTTCLGLNTSTLDGYRMYSVFDHHFLARLLLTELGTPDVRKLTSVDWGQSYVRPGYLGVSDVFGINFVSGGTTYAYSFMFDGLTVQNYTYSVTRNDGSGEWINTGAVNNIKDRYYYPINCLLTKGDGFDMGDLFIAASTDYQTTNGSFANAQEVYAGRYPDHAMPFGSMWSNIANHGMFALRLCSPSTNAGLFRISQVPLA